MVLERRLMRSLQPLWMNDIQWTLAIWNMLGLGHTVPYFRCSFVHGQVSRVVLERRLVRSLQPLWMNDIQWTLAICNMSGLGHAVISGVPLSMCI